MDQFLDEEISNVRAEQWDTLSRGLVKLCIPNSSLNTFRIDMLVVPKRQLVINKLCLMHIARFTGLTTELKEKSMLKEKGATMDEWVAKRDAHNHELRAFSSAAVGTIEKQLLVQYLGELSNWTNTWYACSVRPVLIPCGVDRYFPEGALNSATHPWNTSCYCLAVRPRLPHAAQRVQGVHSSTSGRRYQE